MFARGRVKQRGVSRKIFRTEYWASLMDVFPEDHFDVLGEHTHYAPVDGTQAKALGYDTSMLRVTRQP